MASGNEQVTLPKADTDSRLPPDKNIVAVDELVRVIRGVKFGTVQVIIQDGYIVQIDKTEKIRLK